ncbi:MAG: putative negative regulator of RcsB-dependent stress response [Francisella sp.]|jgi:predicted negative regulator of RcsB-dependent stress response
MIRLLLDLETQKIVKMNIKNLSKKQMQSIYMIIGLLTIAIVCVIALQFYNSNNSKQMLQAATSYQKAIIANENSSLSNADKTAKFETVVKDYPGTSYEIFASWELADLYVVPTKLDTKSFNINIANIPKAIQILQQSAEANPKDNLTNITKTRLAKLYLASNQADKSIHTLQSTTNLQDNAYPLMLLGQAYLQQKDKTKAIQTWQKAEQDQNSSPEFKKIIAQFINNAS